MSPYLFVIIIEALSRLLKQRIAREQSFEYHWRCSKTKLTHLCFADDLIFFCGNSLQSAKLIKDALADFLEWSGLLPNPLKSFIYPAGSNSSYSEDLQNLFQF